MRKYKPDFYDLIKYVKFQANILLLRYLSPLSQHIKTTTPCSNSLDILRATAAAPPELIPTKMPS